MGHKVFLWSSLVLFVCSVQTASAQKEHILKGVASFYGKRSHRDRTSSGERHDSYGFHCAHKTLPFGTMVRVNNLFNGRSTIVRVNDRGPFGRGRVIDLSLAAAKEVRMAGWGIAPVQLQVLYAPPSIADPKPMLTDSCRHDTTTYDVPKYQTYRALHEVPFQQGGYYNVVGEKLNVEGYCLHADNYGLLENAIEAARTLESQGYTPVTIEPKEDHGMPYFRLLVGKFEHPKMMKKAIKRLKDLGHSALVVKYQKNKSNNDQQDF